MLKELFTMHNGIPEWANSLGWAIVLVIIFLIRSLWKNYGSKWFTLQVNEINDRINADKKLLHKIKDIDIHRCHWELTQILDKCYRKGYKNSLDILEFMTILDDYKDIGGNTDGNMLLSEFGKIPYKTELKVPEFLGSYNPSDDAVKQMTEFYNGIKNKIIHENDIKPIKTMTEYVEKEEK